MIVAGGELGSQRSLNAIPDYEAQHSFRNRLSRDFGNLLRAGYSCIDQWLSRARLGSRCATFAPVQP